MPALLARISATAGCLWLDDLAYTAHLLVNDAPPLLTVADFVGFRRQAQALLPGDVVTLPVKPVCDAWLAAHPELLEAMGAKKRAVAPLRALLADASLRIHLSAMSRALRQALTEQPLVLALPSPRTWLRTTLAAVGAEVTAVEQKDADGASVYLAEFLRTFSDVGIDGLLLVEEADDLPASAAELGWYRPVFNVSAHYRWPAGVRMTGGEGPSSLPEGIDFAITDARRSGAISGIALPAGVWAPGAPLPARVSGFTFAEVPSAAKPERVLEVIRALGR